MYKFEFCFFKKNLGCVASPFWSRYATWTLRGGNTALVWRGGRPPPPTNAALRRRLPPVARQRHHVPGPSLPARPYTTRGTPNPAPSNRATPCKLCLLQTPGGGGQAIPSPLCQRRTPLSQSHGNSPALRPHQERGEGRGRAGADPGDAAAGRRDQPSAVRAVGRGRRRRGSPRPSGNVCEAALQGWDTFVGFGAGGSSAMALEQVSCTLRALARVSAAKVIKQHFVDHKARGRTS